MEQTKRVVIVGGVAGGASAATRARRLSEAAEIILLERGEHISFANCGMPYHIGGVIAERQRLLVQTPAALSRRYRIDVRIRSEVLAIHRDRKEILVRDLTGGREYVEKYDQLILSPGAAPVRPPISGLDHPLVFSLRSLADMDSIKADIDRRRPRNALIIGGGYIGLEMAEALRARGVGVTLVELARQVFGPMDPEMVTPLHQQLALHGVDLRLGTSVTAIRGEGDGLAASLSSGQTVACDVAFLAVGVTPESRLARAAGLMIGPTGGIVVDEHMRTNDPAIYAVGDAIEATEFVGGLRMHIPLAGPANRQGRIAADNALGQPSVYRKTQGTAICKVFNLAAGMTGLSEKVCKRAGLAYEKVYVHPSSHAGYYPGAMPLSLKLLFDPAGGKILGAQVVGAEGVDKRIDVLAVALRAGLTVYDLQDVELAYAPPYGSAKDPINYAGFVAANVLKGDVKLCHVADVLSPRDDQMLLDVRTPAEAQAGAIGGAVNIPVDELRSRLGELPRDKELLVYCQVGLRGYLACRMLSQAGFACRNLSGGYKTFKMATETAPPPLKESSAKQECRDDAEAAPSSCQSSAGQGVAATMEIAKQIDARALQCPGPIMRLKAELQTLRDGQAVTMDAADPGFAADVAAWCHSTGNELVSVAPHEGAIRATIVKRSPQAAPASEGGPVGKGKTIVVFSNDFDKVMAAFIIANGAAAMGGDVTLFFTFWGLNVLRRPQAVKTRKNLVERMFGWMMPRGAAELSLSKMNLAGAGLAMIKGIMRKKNMPSLEQLIASAQAGGVTLVACSMSMDLMGIKKEELIDGVELGGVAMYLDNAQRGSVNLFI